MLAFRENHGLLSGLEVQSIRGTPEILQILCLLIQHTPTVKHQSGQFQLKYSLFFPFN
jgi:hypothetical protein